MSAASSRLDTIADRAAALVHSGMVVGLGTGNVESGARLKLAPSVLADRFDFGGFGCDAEDRAELLAIGSERGARALGVSRAECRVVIVGDTPLDVAAAQRIGAECLAVATGGHDVDELSHAGADLALETLADPRARDFFAD